MYSVTVYNQTTKDSKINKYGVNDYISWEKVEENSQTMTSLTKPVNYEFSMHLQVILAYKI